MKLLRANVYCIEISDLFKFLSIKRLLIDMEFDIHSEDEDEGLFYITGDNCEGLSYQVYVEAVEKIRGLTWI